MRKTFCGISPSLFLLFLISSSSPGGGGFHILAIKICAAGEVMVFKPFGLV